MDAFDEFLKTIAGSNAAGREGELSRLHTLCTCRECPTYNECMREKDELLFCIRGKSLSCTFEKKGCLCPNCPVTDLAGLLKAYFCIRGSEQEQRSAAPDPKPAGS